MGTVEKRDRHKKQRYVSQEKKLERELKDCMEDTENDIDDYAIPDEPESYAVNREAASEDKAEREDDESYVMTPEEAAEEDRMVTMAEYGAEMEAETEASKDPSELQYITPIDYAKRIAELDEDLRDAAEILVTECSCYTPFRAFLMDAVDSEFAFIPNKLDLIRDIALGADKPERTAYSNNKYGLVEYTLRSGYVKISYKNRHGERQEGSLDWREIYEVLSYMVKQPFYCGEDQKKYYQETKVKSDRENMNPVYRRFFEIEENVRENRLATRARLRFTDVEFGTIVRYGDGSIAGVFPTEQEAYEYFGLDDLEDEKNDGI